MAAEQSYAQDLYFNPYHVFCSKRKLAPISSAQPSTPSAFHSSPVSSLAEKVLQYLKNEWMGSQRPPGYVPLQKRDSRRVDLICGLGNERERDFERESMRSE